MIFDLHLSSTCQLSILIKVQRQLRTQQKGLHNGFFIHIPVPINGQDQPSLCASRTKTLLLGDVLPLTLIDITSRTPLSPTDSNTAIPQWILVLNDKMLFHHTRPTSENNPTDEIPTTHGSILMESGPAIRFDWCGHDHLLPRGKGSSGT